MTRSTREFNDWDEGTLQIPKSEIDGMIIKLHKEEEARTGVKSERVSFFVFGQIQRAVLAAQVHVDYAILKMMKS